MLRSMNIKHGLELLTVGAGMLGMMHGIGWLVLYIDGWMMRHPRVATAIAYACVAVAIFLAGAIA